MRKNKNKISTVIILMGVMLFLSACQTKRESASAISGRNFGFIIGQNFFTFTPEIRLGYNEFGVLAVEDNYKDNDLVNVVVDSQYRKKATGKHPGGVFQKLAIGKIAVQQPFASSISFEEENTPELQKDLKDIPEKNALNDDDAYEYPDGN